MLLSELQQYIKCQKIYNFSNRKVHFNFLSSNSINIKNKSILIVNNKNKFRKQYIYDAIEKGAIAIITNYYYKEIKIPQFVVKDIDKTTNIILRKLKKYSPKYSAGITGTNGKSSVVWNINQIAHYSSRNINSYGTLGFYKNLKKVENSFLTTPEYAILYQKAFSNKKNLNDFVFEVSSHSISKKRINNFPINIAALTNITQDHLDFHKTLKNYINTKIKLFTKHLSKDGIAIINEKIKYISKIKKELINKNIKTIFYGLKNSDINIYTNKKKSFIKIYKKKYPINIKKFHSFEIENLCCAIGCCLAMNIKVNQILKTIGKITKPPGRFEIIEDSKNKLKIIIDYAHTPDALKNIILANTFKNKKPNILFGCGGNRDKSKRKKMGVICNKFAKKIYVTDDNPRNEVAQKIRKSIIKGCPKAIEISGRRNAIKVAINDLNYNEILIIAGKGHEYKQIIGNKCLNFNDKKIAKYYLNKKLKNEKYN